MGTPIIGYVIRYKKDGKLRRGYRTGAKVYRTYNIAAGIAKRALWGSNWEDTYVVSPVALVDVETTFKLVGA